MEIKNLITEQKESIKHLGILELFEELKKIEDIIREELKEVKFQHIKIQQVQKDFEREAKEIGEIINKLNSFIPKLKYFEVIQPLIRELKSKQDALILASELEND